MDADSVDGDETPRLRGNIGGKGRWGAPPFQTGGFGARLERTLFCGTARGEPDLRRRDRGGCVVGAAGELIKVVAWADAEVDRLHAKCGA